MAIAETRAIVIRNDRGAGSVGTLHVRRFNATDRLLRALAMLVAMWLLALITVLIPVAHFILVPGFLAAGPIVAYMRYRVTEVNERVVGACPTCGQEMTVTLDSSDRLPLWTYCPPAGHPVHLLDAAGAGQ